MTADIRLNSLIGSKANSKELNPDNGHNDVGGREPGKERGREEISYINGRNELLCCLGTQGCMHVAVGD